MCTWHRGQSLTALVARGLTNREIARSLFVSERTAENDVAATTSPSRGPKEKGNASATDR